jgi:hypothetical protein
MTKAAHTPGPWHVEPCVADHGRSLVVTSPNAGIICLIEPDDCATFSRETDAANAALIAAAPELFAAAGKVIASWESGDLAGAVRQLDAAIELAKGGAA